MGDPLIGPKLKVKRAATHLEALHKEIRPFLDSKPKPYRFVSKVDVETSRYVLHLIIERPPPLEWSLLVGDFVQNLRAALDHLIWQMIRANGQKPGGRSAFPIFDQRPRESGTIPNGNAGTRLCAESTPEPCTSSTTASHTVEWTAQERMR